MLSRVANNLFWMDRYMERTNGLLNQIKSNYISNRDYGDSKSWKMIFESYFNIDEEYDAQFTNSEEIINYLIFDSNSGNSIINLVSSSRKNCRSVQEHVSKEIWININKYYLFVTSKIIRKKTCPY